MEIDPLNDELISSKVLDSDSTSWTSEEREKAFAEWRADLLKSNPLPPPSLDHANYIQLEKNRSRGRIISWMYLKELHCTVVKRERGLQYFDSLLSILSLPFYDVAMLAQLGVINRSNSEMISLFERKIKLQR